MNSPLSGIDAPDFLLSLGPHSPLELRVLRFHGEEGVSMPFSFVVEFAVADGVTVDPSKVLGQEALLTLLVGGAPVVVHRV